MTVIVFCGPTIDAAAVRQLLPRALCRAPAARGDVYLACKLRPVAIALIDGYFEHRLSVWHKEILWALSAGVRVYGAASMGALRAAELDAYGMQGVGKIYEAFASGELEDDDEVAVSHAAEDDGFEPQSDAMVNVRASLRAALGAGVIDALDEAALVTAAKSRYYPERSLAALVEDWEVEPKRSQLAQWLATHGMVDQKRADAESLLRLVRRHTEEPVFTPRGGGLRVANTQYWQLLRQSLDAAPAPPGRDGSAPKAGPGRAPGIPLDSDDGPRAVATRRALALALARAAGARVAPEELQKASERFRREQGLLTPEATEQWMADHGLDLPGFSQLVHDGVLIERFGAAAASAAEQQLPRGLRGRDSPDAAPER